jgi:exportin-5
LQVLSVLGDAAASNPEILDTPDICNALVDVMMIAFQHDSLLVSIPVLHSFTKLLVAKSPSISSTMGQRVAVLLGTCSQRLIKYESLSHEELPVILYLNEDFENPPELHSFLGNYRRYCITVIENIAYYMPQEAVGHILDQTVQMVNTICQEFRPPFPSTGPAKTPIPVLQLESQASVLRSTMNGFIQWYSKASRPESKSDQHTTNNVYGVTLTNLRDFCYKLMTMKPQHPEIARLTTHIAVNVLVKTLQGQPELVVKILDYCLSLQYADDPSNKDYSAAVKNFQGARLGEMQRIAMSFPDYLLDVYSDLEARVNSMMSAEDADERTKWGLQAFLFIIVHRASAVDSQARLTRLQQIIQPVIETWQDPQLTEALSTFSGFCSVVGLEGLPEYLSKQRFASVQDWPSQPLDQEGKARQTDVQMKVMRLPLNATKNLLAATTEKLKESSREYQIGAQVWGPAMQAMLSNVLQMTRHATSFPNSSNWSNFPPEMQMVMQKMLVDRFWQAGISNESRDEFYARIAESGDTYEGFASAIRGIPRQIRDWCYHIVYGMTRFEEEFFGLQELPRPLAEALLTDASSLSTHHLQRLIALVERLVQRCPAHHRRHFMPPILSMFFAQTDKKISAEWEVIERSSTQSVEGEDQLNDEMKAESVLRATTYAVVNFASTILDQRATGSFLAHKKHSYVTCKLTSTDVTPVTQPQSSQLTMRTLVLSEASILEPLILFCTHALRMRDSRCCTLICRILRSILPTFTADTPPAPQVREFINTEVLKACITSLNEPYFVDVQRDLANLIANILALYSPLSSTARDVLLSLPDMGSQKVNTAIERIVETNSERTQRVLVLELLEGVRGVSIHEAGKIDRRDHKAKRSAMQQQYMEVEQKPAGGKREQSPQLEGMAEMFGGD